MARKLKNWLNSYIEHTSYSEAPKQFHFWTGVSVIAGALRRKVWLNMGFFEWTPNFYIFFVAPPGIVNKSTTGSIGMDMLRELPYINFGQSAGTWQALVEKMAELEESFPIGNDQYLPMTAVTLMISELGTFIDPRDQLQINVLVDLWDGKQGVWEKSTKKDGSETITNPWINMLGFTTPSWIAENFTDYFSGGGFMSRTIFVYADKKDKLIAYPRTHFPDDFHHQRDSLIEDLEEISAMVGGFEMTPDAIRWGQAWYEAHHKANHTHLSHERFGGYLARKQTHIHKIAMILSASESNDLVLTQAHMEQALGELNRIEQTMPKVFGLANREKEVVIAAEVLTQIKALKSVGSAELYRHFMPKLTFDTFNIIIKSLTHSDYIKRVVKDGKTYFQYNARGRND